jgi:hypothetical protein
MEILAYSLILVTIVVVIHINENRKKRNTEEKESNNFYGIILKQGITRIEGRILETIAKQAMINWKDLIKPYKRDKSFHILIDKIERASIYKNPLILYMDNGKRYKSFEDYKKDINQK